MFDFDGKSFGERSKVQCKHHIDELKRFVIWFEKELNLPIYLIYGTLIGAYREHNLLKHDYDIDIAYLSKENDINKVVEEKKVILDKLKECGLLIKGFGYGHFHVFSLDHSIAFDMWSSWIDSKDNHYAVCAYDAWVTKDDVLPFKRCSLGSQYFNIPRDTDKFLTVYYGDWKTPQTSWKQTTPLILLPNKV